MKGWPWQFPSLLFIVGEWEGYSVVKVNLLKTYVINLLIDYSKETDISHLFIVFILFFIYLFLTSISFPSFLHFFQSFFLYIQTDMSTVTQCNIICHNIHVFFNATFQTSDRFYDQEWFALWCLTTLWLLDSVLTIAVSGRIVLHQHGPYVKPRQQQGAGVINECQHHFQATANKTDIHHHSKTSANAQHDCHVI